jgi:uncharacterized protein
MARAAPRARRWAGLALPLLLGLALAAAAQDLQPVPKLAAHVTDLTGTLTAGQQTALEQKLSAFEAAKGTQLAVLVVPTTQPEEIEQYSIRVAEAWKIGRKGVDDGLILVVAKDDRTLRIEVGYGLEGIIPDSLAKRVIDERIVPRFREGDFYGGVRDGVDQLIHLAEGEKLPPPEQGGLHDRLPPQNVFNYLVPGIILCAVLGSLFKAALGRLPGSAATGAVVSVIAWLLFGLGIAALAFLAGFVLAYANTGCGGGFGGGGSSGRW